MVQLLETVLVGLVRGEGWPFCLQIEINETSGPWVLDRVLEG